MSGFRMVRELFESFAIALVLAFMFKSFLAEAYVIPTGSMAVTLMGAHKDVACEKCGKQYSICASTEFDNGSSRLRQERIIAGTCPICQFTMYFGPQDYGENYHPRHALEPTFTGDRIIVNKSIYDFVEPARWDVSVFRYPASSQTNFIKRMIGLENETIRLCHGDVFVKTEQDSEFRIARKPSRVLLEMLQIVHDTDYETPEIHTLGWPSRWGSETGSAWSISDDYRTYACKGIGDSTVYWLDYRHVVPSSEDWYELSQGRFPEHPIALNPQLITDFSAYNAGIRKEYAREKLTENHHFLASGDVEKNGKTERKYYFRRYEETMGMNWVGDLAVSARLNSDSESGTVSFRLVKGGQDFICSVDLSNGIATLSIPGIEEFQPVSAATPIKGKGAWNIRFANVDEQMRFWVDEQELDFDGKTGYDELCEGFNAVLPRNRSPNEKDLRPSGIGVQGADLVFEHIQVHRDTYYIAINTMTRNCDMIINPFPYLSESGNIEILSEPKNWEDFGKTNVVEFKLEKDQFLMLGDNSAKSKDGRLWTVDGIPSYIEREALIGKAIIVYWPHGWPIPGTKQPFVPNFGKMRFIK